MKEYQGFTANALKIIAIVTMLIDHIGAALVWQMVGQQGDTFYIIYRGMRLIGRIAFPIYCFFIVEGFRHTRSVKKYMARLAVFAIISEIPFDYAFMGGLTLSYQNVFFTLTLGLACIWGFQELEVRMKAGLAQTVLKIVVMLVMAEAAELLHTDYGDFGVIIIAVLYLFQKKRGIQCIVGALGFAWEVTAPLSFVLLYFYNGEKGKQVNKYLFYGFYPVHLAVIGAVRMLCF
ncbi:MAG: conjugal transfer protein TraX [Lachnospiraceae bacterium]|nr:conjugal transfer protein TraX [Lachnospiraceae bacterium]